MNQPRSFDPYWERYVPNITFPSYRHLPGETPHPHKHSCGHQFSFVCGEEPSQDWRDNTMYLLGVDLYNFSFWWEAHEVWEPLWSEARYGSSLRLFSQGLIQLAASLIKWHQGNDRGFRRLSDRGLVKIISVHKIKGGQFMGLQLADFVESWNRFLSNDRHLGNRVISDSKPAPLIRLGVASVWRQ